jgi:hypothetical protein
LIADDSDVTTEDLKICFGVKDNMTSVAIADKLFAFVNLGNVTVKTIEIHYTSTKACFVSGGVLKNVKVTYNKIKPLNPIKLLRLKDDDFFIEDSYPEINKEAVNGTVIDYLSIYNDYGSSVVYFLVDPL